MNRISLKNISSVINSGLTPLRSNPEYWLDGNIPWVKTEQLGEKYIYDSNEKITSYALEKTSIKLNPPNTLSIAMYGEGKTRGSVSILKNETTTNQACCNVVIDKDKADFEFVYYFLKTQYNNLRNLSSGIRKNLNSNDIKNFEIFLPSLSTQKQIAKVLSDLDAKIEVNNKINAELEAMAKLIYDYWFVQFDFPDENGKPYKSSGGKMVYNKELKREIPEGWDVDSLNKHLDYNSGFSFSSKLYTSQGKWKIITIKSVQTNGLDTSKCDKIKDLPDNIDNSCILEMGDLLMSLTGNTGRLCFVDEDNCLLNQRVGKIWSQKFSNLFLYLFFKRPEKQKLIEKLSSGSSQANLSAAQLYKTKMVIPDDNSLKLFKKISNPILEKILLHKKENQKLSELRDWLLPMLMNGQVRVGEAEGQLGMVAEERGTYGK